MDHRSHTEPLSGLIGSLRPSGGFLPIMGNNRPVIAHHLGQPPGAQIIELVRIALQIGRGRNALLWGQARQSATY